MGLFDPAVGYSEYHRLWTSRQNSRFVAQGNVVTTTLVTDWSFTDIILVIQIQTQTWYLPPHSVNINCLDYNGQLYLVSVSPAGTTHN
jgi:hypothetical protein